MSVRSLTESQDRALDLSRPVAVSAGAGSGKTFVLTERYLRALEHVRGRPAPARRVVALTFTEKATLEMRGRVRAGVHDRIRAARRAGDGSRAAFWRGILSELHLARITTFHGFAAGLLREFPLEAGVDPGVEVVDAPTIELLTQESVRTYLSEVSRHPDPGHRERIALAALLRRYRSREVRLMLERVLVEREFTDDWMNSSPPRVSVTLESIGRAVTDRLAAAAAAMVAGVGDEALSLLANPAGAPPGDKLTELLLAIAPHAAHLQKLDLAPRTVEELQRVLLTSSGPARRMGRVGAKKQWGSGPALGRAREAAGALADAVYAELGWYVPFRLGREQVGVEADVWLRVLSRGVRDHFLDRLGRGRRLDFAGLELEARRLLTHPGVARRLRQEIDFLLVDEFQDTNGVQWSLLRSILDAGDPRHPDDATPNLFVVGDDKQAIYEFRGGRVEVFREAASWITSRGGREVSLADNFRTLPHPISVVNHLFARLFDGSPERPYEPQPQALLPRRGGLAGGEVTLLLTPRVDGWEGEADRVADHVLGLVAAGVEIVDPESERPRPVRYEDVAVVVPYRRDFQYLEDAFSARGVTVNVLGGLGFFQTPEVSDTLCLLQALTDPAHDIALAAVLRSPLANLSDPGLFWLVHQPGRTLRQRLDGAAAALAEGPCPDELDADDAARLLPVQEQLARWGRARGRVPSTSLLERAWDETGYRAILAGRAGGANRLANLDKLLEIISAYESRHGIRTAALVEWLETQAHDVVDEAEASEFAREPGVTVMTIHKSKGTEYPVVVVAGLADRGFVADTGPISVHHGVAGTELAFRVPVMRDEDDRVSDRLVPSMAWKLLRERLDDRSDAEAKRVLYVALTRARDRLVLSAQVGAAPPARHTALHWLAGDPGIAEALGATEDMTVDLGGVPVRVLAPRTVGRPDAERADALARALDALGVPPDGFPDRVVSSASVPPPPSTSVTHLSRIAVSPGDAFDRVVLGLDPSGPQEPPGPPEGTAEVADLATPGGTAPIDAPGGTTPSDAPSDARADAAALGRAVHRALALGLQAVDLPAEVAAHMAAFVRSPHGAAAMAAPTTRAEVPFLLPLVPRGRLEGTLDRLYLAEDGVWTVVDAKTSRPRGSETLAAHARRHGYDVQLRLYAVAVRELLELEPDQAVRTVLVFTHPALGDGDREWARTWVERELPSREALGEMVRDLARAEDAPDAAAFASAVPSVLALTRV